MKKVEGSKATFTDRLLDMIEALHSWRLFQQKQPPRLWVTSVGF
jgi:hypothetical protein